MFICLFIYFLQEFFLDYVNNIGLESLLTAEQFKANLEQ